MGRNIEKYRSRTKIYRKEITKNMAKKCNGHIVY